ncbi:hypothetical protein GOODEAATRI_033865, partial [Goodea atripinnis]
LSLLLKSASPGAPGVSLPALQFCLVVHYLLRADGADRFRMANPPHQNIHELSLDPKQMTRLHHGGRWESRKRARLLPRQALARRDDVDRDVLWKSIPDWS